MRAVADNGIGAGVDGSGGSYDYDGSGCDDKQIIGIRDQGGREGVSCVKSDSIGM